jgi:CRISPR/Cas system-associated exonuclease Cas4 (RecB family)
MGLAVSYLWKIMGKCFALRVASTTQFLYLVLCSFAFFFEGYTGLVVTLGAIITLTLLMQITVKVNWDNIMKGAQVKNTFLSGKTT